MCNNKKMFAQTTERKGEREISHTQKRRKSTERKNILIIREAAEEKKNKKEGKLKEREKRK